MTNDSTEAIRLIQSGLDKLGHLPGSIDGQWGVRTARALKSLLVANGRPASLAPPGQLPWISEAKTALGRNEARDRTWLMDWLKRDGRSLGDPGKNPWCGDFVETCIRMALPVTSRKVVRLFLEQFRLEYVPVLHGLQWRLAAQG